MAWSGPRIAVALLVLGVAAVCAGCGSAKPAATLAGAQPYSAKDPRSSFVGQSTAAAFRRPIATYRRHVRKQLTAMGGDVAALRAAASAGNLPAARAAWRKADARYESIGAAYGAFGSLDAAINATPAGLPGGTASPHWTGLQRIEYELWKKRSAAATKPPRRSVRPWARATRKLRRR